MIFGLIILIILIYLFYLNNRSEEYFNFKKTKKYIFIGGLHRSGTSILNKIIGSSSNISKHKNTGKPEDEGQHIQTIFNNGEVHGGVGEFCFDDNYHLTEKSNLITNANKIKLLKQWNKYWNTKKSIFVEKSPVNLIHTRFLQKMFDNSYFIIIMRHPLAVSMATYKWKKQNINKYFDHWLKGYEIYFNDRKYLKNHLVIRYEDLCSNPQNEFKKIEHLIHDKLDIKYSKFNKLYNSNRKYFKKKKLNKKLIDKYEQKFNKFGYSLLNLNKYVEKYPKKKLKFIHIGKCCGTTIYNSNIFSDQYHLKRNYRKNEKYIIWIRNPINRFVSAFNMSYNLINTDTSNLDINNLTFDNCLAPMRVKYKMKHDHTFSKRYDYLVNYFETANKLAESLTSKNKKKRKLALELMNSKKEHIFKGIGWYLSNGNFVKKRHKDILFVGSCENMVNDINKLSKLLNVKINPKNHIRKNKIQNDNYLSNKAVENIINFYKETDYKSLKTLLKYNFITKDLFKKYHDYTI